MPTSKRSFRVLLAVVSVLAMAACTIDVDIDGTGGPAASESSQSYTSKPLPKPPLKPALSAEQGELKVAADAVVVPGGAIAIRSGDVTAESGNVDMPAWSSIKVPLSIAALRENPSLVNQVTAAITRSSNADAEALWSSLGTPDQAARKTQQVLAEGDSPTTVQREITRPGFSSFGQTKWRLADQIQFASHLHCIDGAEPVLAAMGHIVADQSYGLGRIPGALFKGGWGPDESGRYQVRQFGLIPVKQGYVAVAVAVSPADGTYESGQARLDEMATKLQPLLGQMKPVSC